MSEILFRTQISMDSSPKHIDEEIYIYWLLLLLCRHLLCIILNWISLLWDAKPHVIPKETNSIDLVTLPVYFRSSDPSDFFNYLETEKICLNSSKTQTVVFPNKIVQFFYCNFDKFWYIMMLSILWDTHSTCCVFCSFKIYLEINCKIQTILTDF